MKRWTRFPVILGTLLISSTSNAADDGLDINRADHQLHIACSYGLTLTSYEILGKTTELSKTQRILISAGSVLAIGLAKEAFFDKQFSVGDAKANLIGVAGGILIPITIDF